MPCASLFTKTPEGRALMLHHGVSKQLSGFFFRAYWTLSDTCFQGKRQCDVKCWLRTFPPEDPGLLCYSEKLILQDTDQEGQECTLQAGAVKSGWPELCWSKTESPYGRGLQLAPGMLPTEAPGSAAPGACQELLTSP